ncbi:MAG: DUF1624 domain-containing protein [Ruminiclostridium sp.]|nr:DUF1624 domain-containing protein [Ruminiclostridium sp.]
MQSNLNTNRIWELDFFRGLALILMSYFHLIYDMKEFYGYSVNYEGNITYYIGKLSAILFITISGVSANLSRSSWKRGLKVLGAGLSVTLVSYIFDNDYFVIFGILHFLGLSMILSVLFRKLDSFTLLAAGMVILALGYAFPIDNLSNNYLMVLGFTSQTFTSSDYYPLIPYLGIFLIGMVLGRMLYPNKKSLIKPLPGHHFISIAGRHSLLIYLLHQPMILLMLYLISSY